MMNTKKIAALSLLVIFGIGKVSAKLDPFKVDVNAVMNSIAVLTNNDTSGLTKKDNTTPDEGKLKLAADKIANMLITDASDKAGDIKDGFKLGDNSIVVAGGKKFSDFSDENKATILLYHYTQKSTSGGNSSSDGYDVKWLVGVGVIGLVIGGAGAYFVLSGSGGSDE